MARRRTETVEDILALPSGWTTLRPHDEQQRFYASQERFNIALAGRRSGKSDIGRRRFVRKALVYHKHPDGLFLLGAPTWKHVKELHWRKLKDLIPRGLIALRNGKTPRVSEQDLSIELIHNGVMLQLFGLDVPERVEGRAVDHFLLDEVAQLKGTAWAISIRPTLSDREGSCDFIGKPAGKGFYFELWTGAAKRNGWDRFYWTSEDILPADEIASAKRDLSPKEYAQEYLAEWTTFKGRAYYDFEAEIHAATELKYDPETALDLCLDFNVKPGVGAIVQDQSVVKMRYLLPSIFRSRVTAVIDEVWIEDDSNTRKVCRAFLKKWRSHKGEVRVFGDATGGARGTAAVEGSDWDIVRHELGPVFGNRLKMRVPDANPKERARINALNARILDAEYRSSLLVCPVKAPRVVIDLESVTVDDQGQLEKPAGTLLTHISDGLGYREHALYPTTRRRATSERLPW